MIFFLVEEYSMKKFLEGILSRLEFEANKFEIKAHNGKGDLIANLDKIVPTLSKRAQRIIVILDQDKQNCIELKDKIRGKMVKCSCDYTIRIACYELEAWFLGDMHAIAQCSDIFKVQRFQNKEKYRDVDNVQKPSDAIRQIVPDWQKKYGSKSKFSERIATEISLKPKDSEGANRSHSFHIFLDTLRNIQLG